MADRYCLAQANIARMIAPLDDPIMSDFVKQLDYVNAVADHSAGFVWRLQTPDGDATAIRAFGDPLILLNMSVWQDLEALYRFTYQSDHLGPLRARRKWFDRIEGAHLVLWWIPSHHRPTIDEAKQRFDLLDRVGPGPSAFTFKHPYASSGERLLIQALDPQP